MKRVALAAAVLACVTGASAAISSGEAARLTEAASVVRDMRTSIPADYWTRTQCIVVIPNLKKAAFFVGGEYGKGVMSCRAGDEWSAPLFMQLAKGSWGFQAGAQQVDLVLLVMNESGVQKLLQNKVTLGVDAAVAAGPVGRQAAAATDAQLKAEIISYSRAEGLFAGVDLSGGLLRPDEDAKPQRSCRRLEACHSPPRKGAGALGRNRRSPSRRPHRLPARTVASFARALSPFSSRSIGCWRNRRAPRSPRLERLGRIRRGSLSIASGSCKSASSWTT
jgi:lipid-binding SYLF domain-containing protein